MLLGHPGLTFDYWLSRWWWFKCKTKRCTKVYQSEIKNAKQLLSSLPACLPVAADNDKMLAQIFRFRIFNSLKFELQWSEEKCNFLTTTRPFKAERMWQLLCALSIENDLGLWWACLTSQLGFRYVSAFGLLQSLVIHVLIFFFF